MATYAIGDIQGCYRELRQLLYELAFDPAQDRLWLLGDLINRGPDNLAVLRYVMSLGDSASTVLGNHDLHFLAIRLGGHKVNRSDTFQDVLDAQDVDEIVAWYCQQPLVVHDQELGFAMAHAGIPHLWDLTTALQLAQEVEQVLKGAERDHYFKHMYGNQPAAWSEDLEGMDRLRVITNYFTRMRLISANGDLNFSHKGALADAPDDCIPWYELRAGAPLGLKLLFGHWAALEGETGHDDIIALDTGCVWGRTLTALCLDTGEVTSASAFAE